MHPLKNQGFLAFFPKNAPLLYAFVSSKNHTFTSKKRPAFTKRFYFTLRLSLLSSILRHFLYFSKSPPIMPLLKALFLPALLPCIRGAYFYAPTLRTYSRFAPVLLVRPTVRAFYHNFSRNRPPIPGGLISLFISFYINIFTVNF